MKLYDNIIRILGKKQATSYNRGSLPSEMVSECERQAIKNSYDIYCGRAPWLSQGRKGLCLASGIVSELARLTLTEFKAEFGDKARDVELERCFNGFISRIRRSVEYACATGGVIFKPCCDGKRITVKTVLPFEFLPLSTDPDGKINECAFLDYTTSNGKKYMRIEAHKYENGVCTVTNRAFRIENGGSLVPCPLSSVEKWKDLSIKAEIEGLRGPLFAYFSMPDCNSDPTSPLGVPIFRRAESLIKEADLQFSRLLWEFEGGELAIDASEDAFRVGKDGKPRLPEGKERLYRTNALDACCSSNELLKTFAPELRDKSLINGLNRIVMFVEDACGIARGTFSDPSEVAKTATEVRSMRQRTYSTVTSIQTSLSLAISELVRCINDIANLYGIWERDATINVSFGDGVLADSESERKEQREDVKYGIITAEEFKQKWYA